MLMLNFPIVLQELLDKTYIYFKLRKKGKNVKTLYS